VKKLALLALLPLAASAQAPEAHRLDAVRPRALLVYGADDPAGLLKARIEELMGVYLVDPPRRHASERVTMKGGDVKLTYWQTIASASDEELLAKAVQWFVFGRTQYATGVRGVFSEMPAVDHVELAFEEVVRPERRGRRRGDEELHEYLSLDLSRAKFGQLDLERAKQCVQKGRCGAVARDLFDHVRFDARYVHARQGAR
jgi:hypothetical protein